MTVTRSTVLDRSAAGLVKPARKQPIAQRPSLPAAPAHPGQARIGGGMSPAPATTVALSDGTRISFRAVEELPELVD